MKRFTIARAVAWSGGLCLCLGTPLIGAATLSEQEGNDLSDHAPSGPELTGAFDMNGGRLARTGPNAQAFETAAGTAAIDCVCAGAQYEQYELVYALEDEPAGATGIVAGAKGRIISGNPSLFTNRLLVEWEGWFDGHDGNGFAQCPPEADAGTSRWWVPCEAVARFVEIPCACAGQFQVGDRVVAIGDELGVGVAPPGLGFGSTGTVVSGYTDPDALPILVEWDDWAGGHGGNGFTRCPLNESATADNRYWVRCSQIARIETQGEIFCVCNASYDVGDEVELEIGGYDGAALFPGDRGHVLAGKVFGGTPHVLVEFIQWEGGHSGISPSDACPSFTPEGQSRWWLPCSYVSKVVCDGDLNGDGVVNGADLTIVLGAWGLCD